MTDAPLSRSDYPLTAYAVRFPLTPFVLLLCGHQLGQPALLPSRRVLMDDVLLTGAVEELDGLVVCSFSLRARGGAHPLERGAELTALGAIQRSPRASLTHSFGG